MGKLASLEELFVGRHYDRDVLILRVRWYARFNLSLRDLVEMMAERGLWLAQVLLADAMGTAWRKFEKRWHQLPTVGRCMACRRDVQQIRGVWRCLPVPWTELAGRSSFRLKCQA